MSIFRVLTVKLKLFAAGRNS